MPKVCILVHTHSFLDTRIFQKEAKSLKKNGYDVVMIVPRIKGKLFKVNKEPFDSESLENALPMRELRLSLMILKHLNRLWSICMSRLRTPLCFLPTRLLNWD